MTTPRLAALALAFVACAPARLATPAPAWGPLRWEMAPREAEHILDAGGFSPHDASSDRIEFTSQSFAGVVVFDGGRMSEIVLTSPGLRHPAIADALFAKLRERYGDPASTETSDHSAMFRWELAGTTVTATAAGDPHDGALHVTERLVPRRTSSR